MKFTNELNTLEEVLEDNGFDVKKHVSALKLQELVKERIEYRKKHTAGLEPMILEELQGLLKESENGI